MKGVERLVEFVGLSADFIQGAEGDEAIESRILDTLRSNRRRVLLKAAYPCSATGDEVFTDVAQNHGGHEVEHRRLRDGISGSGAMNGKMNSSTSRLLLAG